MRKTLAPQVIAVASYRYWTTPETWVLGIYTVGRGYGYFAKHELTETPKSLSIDADGTVYVLSSSAVREYSGTSGRLIRAIRGTFDLAAVSPDGEVYATLNVGTIGHIFHYGAGSTTVNACTQANAVQAMAAGYGSQLATIQSGRLRVYSPGLVLIGTAPFTGAQLIFSRPLQDEVDVQAGFWTIGYSVKHNDRNWQIRDYSPEGAFTVDRSGNVYIAHGSGVDEYVSRAFVRTIGDPAGNVIGVLTDRQNRIYLLNPQSHSVHVFTQGSSTPSGTLYTPGGAIPRYFSISP